MHCGSFLYRLRLAFRATHHWELRCAATTSTFRAPAAFVFDGELVVSASSTVDELKEAFSRAFTDWADACCPLWSLSLSSLQLIVLLHGD
jgi:hypothetical protein